MCAHPRQVGKPQFLDERHWGLFYELLASSPTKTIPLRLEMLRVISSALAHCVGIVGSDDTTAAVAQPTLLPELSLESRLAIVRMLEASVQSLTSTYSQFFISAVDHYVSYLSRVVEALGHLYAPIAL